VNGRKRHILVDTEGLLIRAAVLSAGIQDADGATDLLTLARPVCPRLEQIWADGAYAGYLVEWTREQCGWRLVIVSKPPDQQGFQVVPRRWVVERTFGWLGRNRRLSKDYEEYAESGEAWLYLASIRLLFRRRTR
jgi:putative transposase